MHVLNFIVFVFIFTIYFLCIFYVIIRCFYEKLLRSKAASCAIMYHNKYIKVKLSVGKDGDTYILSAVLLVQFKLCPLSV